MRGLPERVASWRPDGRQNREWFRIGAILRPISGRKNSAYGSCSDVLLRLLTSQKRGGKTPSISSFQPLSLFPGGREWRTWRGVWNRLGILPINYGENYQSIGILASDWPV